MPRQPPARRAGGAAGPTGGPGPYATHCRPVDRKYRDLTERERCEPAGALAEAGVGPWRPPPLDELGGVPSEIEGRERRLEGVPGDASPAANYDACPMSRRSRGRRGRGRWAGCADGPTGAGHALLLDVGDLAIGAHFAVATGHAPARKVVKPRSLTRLIERPATCPCKRRAELWMVSGVENREIFPSVGRLQDLPPVSGRDSCQIYARGLDGGHQPVGSNRTDP